MTFRSKVRRAFWVALATTGVAGAQPVSLSPATMPRIGGVDERFQSFNTEMLEVTGGRFWKPYKDYPAGSKPAPGSADLYAYRPPADLTEQRLRKLAAALGPFYLRVSGTWANSTYFQDSDADAPAAPPKGFNAVLTRKQWKGVIDFARAVHADLMISFAISDGTRDASGVWTPDQARALLAYTKSIGGRIAAVEFMNEPDVADHGAAPKGYDASAYGRDVAVFRTFLKQNAPDAVFVGPGSVMEGGKVRIPIQPGLATEKLLQATGPVYDAFAYHLYAALSQRCGGAMPGLGTTAAAALSEEWLSRNDSIHGYYAGLRDKYEPGKPIWLTETGETGCGGDPWSSTYVDTFRYLYQHARLAQKGVQMIAHNTLSASDYALLDEKTLDPRPDYWAALLWRRLMGSVVLDSGAPSEGGLYLFSQCSPNRRGAVTVLAINTATAARELNTAMPGERYTLAAKELQSESVELNGRELQAGPDGALPSIQGMAFGAGSLSLPPASSTFATFPRAGNKACQ
jgi:heparanase 1